MATDLIQRAAAICGLDNPNSDQLAAWLEQRVVAVQVRHDTFSSGPSWPVEINDWRRWGVSCFSLLEALAAAVVEVDRIEREART